MYGGSKVIIKASASLRNDYSMISNLAKATKEPIYITKNGEGDLYLYTGKAKLIDEDVTSIISVYGCPSA